MVNVGEPNDTRSMNCACEIPLSTNVSATIGANTDFFMGLLLLLCGWGANYWRFDA